MTKKAKQQAAAPRSLAELAMFRQGESSTQEAGAGQQKRGRDQKGQGFEQAARPSAADDLIRALSSPHPAVGVTGLAGAARAWACARLKERLGRPLIFIAASESDAGTLEGDLRFFFGESSDSPQRVLRLPADEILPYDDLSPEAATAQTRLSALHHLHSGADFDVLLLSPASLARKVLPRKELAKSSLHLRVNNEQPLDDLAHRLAGAGYQNMPLVEDPGTFAVRGGIVDVFSPLYSRPARLEFFGDTIESIRFFDPDSQRTSEHISELEIAPARELLLSESSRQLGAATIRAAADAVSKPSTEVRELIDELNEGVLPFGIEALLPGFYEGGFEALSSWFPTEALLVVDDPEQVIDALEQLDGELEAGFAAARKRGDLVLAPDAHFLSSDTTLSWLSTQPRVEIQNLELNEWSELVERGELEQEAGARGQEDPGSSGDQQSSGNQQSSGEQQSSGNQQSSGAQKSSGGQQSPGDQKSSRDQQNFEDQREQKSSKYPNGSEDPRDSGDLKASATQNNAEAPDASCAPEDSKAPGSAKDSEAPAAHKDPKALEAPETQESRGRLRQPAVHPAWKEASEKAAQEARSRRDRWKRLGDLPVLGSAPVRARFRLRDTAILRREIQEYRGDTGALEPLVERLYDWRDQGLAALIAAPSAGQAEKLRRLLADREISSRVLSAKEQGPGLPANPGKLYDPAFFAHILSGEISSGFIDSDSGFALLSDEDIFGPRSRARVARRRREETFTRLFRDLKEGDLIVHVEHGIARYLGLTRLRTGSYDSDFLILQFAGTDKLYLPVHRLRQVQKYVGGDADKVRLDSLKSKAFSSRKARVKAELLRMAAELLNIYAARKAHPGHAFGPVGELYHQVEADFPYDETPDQAKAIAETLEDMGRPSPMDRLVCGDVGYGKTEIAIRAAAKAVEDGKQVAILVPTTVLAAQHLHSFGKRFANYPVNVEMVSRFRDAGQLRDTLKKAADGQVDILIGTHRLLSSDVSFKNLGLLVVDEEQRFGVKHKEALKRYRKTVDVLTLTATPIPRTLHMSLMGVRDLSIIATPPANRRPIRTFVMRFDEQVVREAIEREMSRGGQVFFLHNRVQSIEALGRHVRELVPKAKVAVAHGQMAEGELERVMTEFVEKKHDVLVCTTIIESGLDIPSANTILVNRADNFGLAQLYQIRGRVGRSADRAFCYLFIPSNTPITQDARKRLQVLQQYTELGAGFHVASHDLEIRGAGNLLGPDQSGTIAAVGFDLYSDLMEEAVRELKGEPPRNDIEPDVSLRLPAFIPEEYIPDVGQRLHFYRRLAQAAHSDELYDVRSELADRFGELPEEVDHLCQLMSLKAQMRQLNLRALESGPRGLVLTLGGDARLDPLRIAQLVGTSRSGLRLTPDMKLVVPLNGNDPSTLLEGGHRLLRELAS